MPAGPQRTTRSECAPEEGAPALIGESEAFTAVRRLIPVVAGLEAPVLIEGETGTGKELVARAIHAASSRANQPFIAINCGAIPETLIESELFGHRRGTFTGAQADRPGLVALADQGTLFLDEIDSLSPRAQVTLLRFLQDHRYRPLGAREECSADIRVISAAGRNLDELAQAGHFRFDLLFRLKLLFVALPPLRARAGDVRQLTEHFLRQCAQRFGTAEKRLSPDSYEWLERQMWPGNVRELENLLCREFLLAQGDEIHFGSAENGATKTARAESTPALVARPYRAARAHALAQFDRVYLSHVLKEARGNVSRAARLSGKERTAFKRMLKKYDLAPESFRVS